MPRRTLDSLIRTLPQYQISGPPNPVIQRIVSDNRKVEPGSCFVAYRGVAVDGHTFIADAIRRGATTVVAETAKAADLSASVTWVQVPNGREALAHLMAGWYDHPSQKLTLVGVTGSDGKTSTVNLIYAILRQAGLKTGMINTVNAVINDTPLDTGLHVTTPDASDVQRYLAQMVEAGTEVCLLETTSHGLDQHRVTACDYDIAVVTNITHEHLDTHGTLEAYREAKARLFDMAARYAVLNADDSSYDFLWQRIQNRILILSYGLSPQAQISADQIRLQPDATLFKATLNGQTYQVETPLVGQFNVSNILAALATCVIALEIEPEIALAALRTFQGVPGRMERIDLGQPYTAIVDFAHSPVALQRALETVRMLTDKRIIAVFGCAGLRDVEKRTLMGHVAAELADITIITAEDPRTEDLDTLIATTAEAMREKNAIEGPPFDQRPVFYRIPDRGRALHFATELARPGDIVIALGKGHEQSMCFGTTEHPWDDREALRAAIRGKPLLTLPTA